MPKVNHQELEGMIEKTDEEKESLIVRGDTGIGKSVVVKEKAKKMADKEGREFLEWNDLSVEKREEIVEGEVDYEEVFIFIDKSLLNLTLQTQRVSLTLMGITQSGRFLFG